MANRNILASSRQKMRFLPRLPYLCEGTDHPKAAVAYDIRAMEVGRVDCLNYAKRGGVGNVGKLFQIIKKKIRLGRILSLINRKKKLFVELISATGANDATDDQSSRTSDFQQLFKLFCELHAQYQERDRGTREVYSMIAPAPPL
jgi:hypothetical protein